MESRIVQRPLGTTGALVANDLHLLVVESTQRMDETLSREELREVFLVMALFFSLRMAEARAAEAHAVPTSV